MKWFKHLTNALRDPFIVDLIDQYKGDGYLAYFGIIEMIAEEWSVDNGGRVVLKMSFLKKNLQISAKKIQNFLKFFEKNKKIFSKLVGENGSEVELYCPKLNKIASDYAKRQLREKFEVGSESPT